MTHANITMIERELGILLPESYRQAVCPFRIPALAGNTDGQLWDEPKRLTELNRKLRAGTLTRPAWPAHLFAVGDPHGDGLIALDTRSSDAPVWWLDHGCVDAKASFQSHARFVDWVEEFYRDTLSDLEGDGINPENKSKEKPMFGWEYWLALVGMVIIVLAIMLLVAWIKSWMRK